MNGLIYAMKLLIVRNDKLGDFILSIPVFALIKKYCPQSELHAFIPHYTSEIAVNCNYIDKAIIDPGSSATLSEQLHTIKSIRQEKYDAIITLYTTSRMGIFSFLSGVKYRLAPATKIAQIFYNHRLTQRRSKSLKPEYEYNKDLAIKFLADQNITVKEQPQTPYLIFRNEEIAETKRNFYHEYQLDSNTRLIFIHPGTGGSATNLSLEQYANLARNLNISNNYIFVITAGPNEVEYANTLSTLLGDIPNVVYPSINGLVNFSKIIQLCDLFISGSTGPLHIAGALNRPTAAFYQRRRSATPLRWQTLNSEDKRLAFTPPEDADESDMQKIDIIKAANKISDHFLKI